MERYLLTVEDERGNDNLLHVSDLVKDKWCPRMLYYRMGGVRPEIEPIHFQLQNIFDYGSETHLKFQRRWRDMGVLWGRWKCLECKKSWRGMPPLKCVRCGLVNTVVYAEVPLADPDLLLVGNADAEIRDTQGNVLVEIKTVAEGTIRAELPNLLREYTREVILPDNSTEKQVDIKQLWKDLRRPMPSHRRQGQTYTYLRGKMTDEPPVEGIVFLYESKQSQGLKEFEVEPDKKVAEEVLGRAADVAWSVNQGRPLRCPEGRDGCKLCQPYEEEVRRGSNTPQAAAPAPRRRTVYSGGQRV